MITACITCDLVLLAMDRVAEAIKMPVVPVAHASTKRAEQIGRRSVLRAS